MAAMWYVLQESVAVGPIDANALIQMCREGSVTPHTMVWRNGYEDWIPAGRVKGLATEFGLIPPIGPSSVDEADRQRIPTAPEVTARPMPPGPPAVGSDSVGYWNPTSAVAWGLLLTAAFPALLISMNWRRLGDAAGARRSTTMFYVVLAWCAVKLFVLLPIDLLVREVPSFVFWVIDLSLLVSVFQTDAKPQGTLLREQLGPAYPRRSWGIPLLIGAGSLVAYVVLLVVFAVVLGLATEFP